MSIGPNYQWFAITVTLSVVLEDTKNEGVVSNVFRVDAQATNPVTALENVIQSIYRNHVHVDGRQLSIYDVEENVLSVEIVNRR